MCSVVSVFDLKSIVFFTQVPQFLLMLEVDRGAGTVNFSKMFSNVSLPETHTFKNYKITQNTDTSLTESFPSASPQTAAPQGPEGLF